MGFYDRGIKDTCEEAAVKTMSTDVARAERYNEGNMLMQFKLKHDSIAVFYVRLHIPY